MLLNLENQSHAVIATCWGRATARAVQLRQYKQYKNIFKSIVLSLVSCEIKLLLYFYNCQLASLFYPTLLFSIFKLFSAKFRL